jgi:CubicO group peptidase (beta-lactamase class C family)
VRSRARAGSRTLGALTLGAMLCASAGGGSAAEPFDLGAAAAARIDGTPGVGIAIGTIDDGKIATIFRGSTGTAAKLDRDAVFEIGSVTKTFTALLLADMAGRGEVTLDQPIDALLPKGVTAPARGGKKITLLDLATQSSGLPRLPDNLAPKDWRDPYRDYDRARMFEFLSHYTLTRDPGASYEYSNYAVGLLGELLALRAGKPYAALLRERVLDPLRMLQTAVDPTTAMAAHEAAGHDADGDPVAHWHFAAIAPAGGLRSSLGDMLRYLGAMMTLDGPLGGAARVAEQPRRDAFPGTRIGLVWNTDVKDGIVWHDGETGGFHAFVGFDAARTRGIVILANTAGSISDIARHWLDPAFPLADIPATIPVTAQTLAAYAGSYDLAGMPFVVTVDGEKLYAKLGAQPRFRVFPSAPNEFFYKVVPARLTFVMRDGRADVVILHQNGQDIPAKRANEPGATSS